MSEQELMDQLYDKMAAEQRQYKDWLLSQAPEDILSYSYEFAMREDILMMIEGLELDPPQSKALLRSSSPLADIYKDYSKKDDSYLEDIRDTIQERADKLIKQNKERSER